MDPRAKRGKEGETMKLKIEENENRNGNFVVIIGGKEYQVIEQDSVGDSH